MMNNDMTGLLNLAYEIEGLLLLHINRGDEAAPEMKQLLLRKAESLLDGLRGDCETPAPVATSVCGSSAAHAVVTEEFVAPAVSDAPDATVAQVNVGADQIGMSDDEAIAANVEFEEAEDAGTQAPEEAGTRTCQDDGVRIPDEKSSDLTPAEQPSGLTLDEKLARERATDISKAFTLNDRFRFCRELFRNSNDEFKETLEVIGSMADMDEAEDYFYNDLCWDPDNGVVKEFMAIVAKHF